MTQPVVRRSNELAVEVARGNPNITKVTFGSNFMTNSLVGVSHARQGDGVECGMHNHRGVHEVFYVTSGYGVIVVEGERHPVQTGDFVLVPAGYNHNVIGYDPDGLDGTFELMCLTVVAEGHEGDSTPWVGTE